MKKTCWSFATHLMNNIIFFLNIAYTNTGTYISSMRNVYTVGCLTAVSFTHFSSCHLNFQTSSRNTPHLKQKPANRCWELHSQFFMQSTNWVLVFLRRIWFLSHGASHSQPDSEQQWGLETCLLLLTPGSDMAWSGILGKVDNLGCSRSVQSAFILTVTNPVIKMTSDCSHWSLLNG